MENNSDNFNHTVAIAAIVKNEGPYIREWIKHHINIGVTKIYLYNNGSEDDTIEIITPYIEKGIVQHIWCPEKAMQYKAYAHAAITFRKECRYMAIIDADEFIMPCDTSKSLPEVIDEIFALDPNAGGIVANWRVYGSSGYIEKPEGGVLENYLYRMQDDDDTNAHVKTIFNPRDVQGFLNPHFPVYNKGKYSINERGERTVGAFNITKGPLTKIRINHYYCKSKAEFIKRKSLGDANTGAPVSLDSFYEYDKNDVYDDIGLTYAELIGEISAKGRAARECFHKEDNPPLDSK